MTKVLVTGGSGKMGQVIVRDLLANGYEVVSTDRKAPSSTDGFEFIAADVTDPDEAMRVMEGCDKVIHMAAIPNPFIASEWEVLRVNTMSNWAVLGSRRETRHLQRGNGVEHQRHRCRLFTQPCSAAVLPS